MISDTTKIALCTLAGLLSHTWADVPVIPRPVKETTPNGAELTEYEKLSNQASQSLLIGKSAVIKASKELSNEKEMLQLTLDKLKPSKTKEAGAPITLTLDKNLPEEGYLLKVSPEGVKISGGSPAGVFYGIQSLSQMLLIGNAKGNLHIPFMVVEDAPTCTWRGAMMDSARHFQNKEFVKKFIDAMSSYKLNRLHWHIVDSEGWRLEIKKYPKLTEVCKDFPAEYSGEDPADKTRPAKFKYGHFHGGGYFTQEDIKEIVKYAKQRHIEIIPEIGFPAHAMVALTAYPEYSTTGKVPTVRSNISPDLYAVNEKSLNFLKDILDETMELFPYKVIHFGGDEAPKGQWKDSKEAQEVIKKNNLSDETELQAWMFNQLAKHIESKGRQPAGWEEIMHGNNFNTLTKSAIIYPWLSHANGVKSANTGHGIIHCQFGTFYLDSPQTDSPAENWALYGTLPMERIYNFNLFPEGLTEEGKKNVLGAQVQLWSELMPHAENVEYQAFPRLTTLAELTWTPKDKKDYKHYYARLAQHPAVLDSYKLNYRYINPLPVAEWSPESLDKDSFDIDLTPESIKNAKGEMIAEFAYKKGAKALEINKVELILNGKVIATDEHEGKTGTQSKDNAYRLKFKQPLKGKAQLRVHHKNGGNQDSHGEITVVTGKGLDFYNPRNFRGGDYPTASWNKDDTKQNQSQIRIPMDGLIKQAGTYELIVNAKDLTKPAIVGAPLVQGTSGKGSQSKEIATLNADNSQGIVPLTIVESDVKAGNSIILHLKNDAPFAGEVRVRPIATLTANAQGAFEWNPAILEKGSIIAYAHDVKANENGKITVSFRFHGGSNGLDIKWVQLVSKGKILVEDKHDGFTGGNPKNNVYTLESPAIKAGQTYSLRMMIAGAGGTESKGAVETN